MYPMMPPGGMPMMPPGMPMPPGGGMMPMPPNNGYDATTVDPSAAMQMMPGLDPMLLAQLLAQGGDPMAMAEAGRGAAPPGYAGGPPPTNPLLAALMQFGMMPPQAM